MKKPVLRVLSLVGAPGLVLAEIAVFILVGKELGILATLGLVVLTSMIGLMLVAAQGIHHLNRLQSTLAAGELPVADMVHGLLLMIAGFLLFIPGFISDVGGLLLLLPPVRAAIGRALLRRWRGTLQTRQSGDGVTIIEGEFQEAPPPKPPPKAPGGTLPRGQGT